MTPGVTEKYVQAAVRLRDCIDGGFHVVAVGDVQPVGLSAAALPRRTWGVPQSPCASRNPATVLLPPAPTCVEGPGCRAHEDVDHVGQLLRDSPEFAHLRSRSEARDKSMEIKRFVHPDVGSLTQRMQSFDVRSSHGPQLVTYHAEPGSPSADAINMLGSLTATQNRIRPGRRH